MIVDLPKWTVFMPMVTPSLVAFAAALRWHGMRVIISDMNNDARRRLINLATFSMTEDAEKALRELSDMVEFISAEDELPHIDLAILDEDCLYELQDDDLMNDGFLGEESFPDMGMIDRRFQISDMIALFTQKNERWLEVEGINNIDTRKCFGVRYFPEIISIENIEIFPIDSTDYEIMEKATKWARESKLAYSILDYDAWGGAQDRVRVPLETEAWRLVREAAASIPCVDYLSRVTLGCQEGLLSQVRKLNPVFRTAVVRDLALGSFGDTRFIPFADQFPLNPTGKFWSQLDEKTEFENPDTGIKIPEKILIVGTPQLVSGWKERINESSSKKLSIIDWPIWDISSIEEETIKVIEQNGPYDLIIECLIAPLEQRQPLLEAVYAFAAKDGQIWLHNLNFPATVTVQVLPEQFCAVGFGGLPPIWDEAIIEMTRPSSTDTSQFQQAMETARAIGLHPFEVADEPGGVGARLLAMLINMTSFLYREGIVSSPAAADKVARQAFNLRSTPFQMADLIGLDVIEAILMGLAALLGEDRYRVCPDIILRIESGAVGNATGKGFYLP